MKSKLGIYILITAIAGSLAIASSASAQEAAKEPPPEPVMMGGAGIEGRIYDVTATKRNFMNTQTSNPEAFSATPMLLMFPRITSYGFRPRTPVTIPSIIGWKQGLSGNINSGSIITKSFTISRTMQRHSTAAPAPASSQALRIQTPAHGEAASITSRREKRSIRG